MTSEPISIAWLARATLVVVAVVSLFWLAWQLTHMLFLLLGAIVVAVILTATRDLMSKYVRLREKWALGSAILLFFLLIGGFLFLMGSQLAGEFGSLRETLPDAIAGLGDRIGVDVLEQIRTSQFSWRWQIVGFAPDLIGAVSSIVVVIVGGVFLAINPAQYRDGLLKLFPKPQREPVGEALNDAGNALRLWLIGKLIAMAVIWIVSTIGLYLVGVPSPLALGMIAGLLEFIPFIGPILSFIPAAAVALSTDQTSFWWVLALYVAIQQLENNLLVPLIQQRTVELPPVLGLFAIVGLGLLFGPVGIILGIPLTIIAMVLVKHLYIENYLGDRVSIPGRQEGEEKIQS